MHKKHLGFSYKNQILHAESVAITDLMAVYGSPLYVYSRMDIENNWREFDQAFGDHPHLVCYAVKANSNLAVLNVLAKLGSGFDIVSIGELERVLVAGGKAGKCVFSGVAKTKIEIERALEVGVRCFNVESASELSRIESVARSVGKQAPISIRVNPNVDAKTHPYISTGLKENKFGVDMSNAIDLYQQAQDSKYLNVQGLDCHIGSQITEVSPFLDALDKVLVLLKQLKDKGIGITHLDLGGGIGIDYEGEQTIDIQNYIDVMISKVENIEIILEPGRAIVGNAGIFMTKVEFLKQNSEHSFAIVDGAMNDLLRPSFYNAYHQVLPINKNAKGIQAHWDLVGPICETGDFLAKNRALSLSEGDYLALMSAGAYGFTMSSNYNTRPRVAEVMVSGTNHQLVRQRESVQDLFAQERLYE
ncbi:Diaminopimelate decarboxylase (EC 4.1.1.20) [uncultured Gammaproteobacteria bacterium]|uniref:Diaminopimelate decarboxylase (EC) n=2 Tax=sulfur-oxidizing symbionts TaxID=32036 RepID=A0ACA8ZPF5_9GAMM|nr:Diaminopimelate decarboxylase (EC [Bathymodiolus azoricus thioautotrophic gill symbiont]CAB5501638.1 Diaminopimelate decarboxylase (EC [Bathymodiolus thermophilus thioautotrophic gill symbiont]CAC9513741.1 Diaminopimelate decarboxylase (EC 4.1.1.20) [uncultured Gammaproteobacteria bacterium]CAC9519239.1 Diaminopimelate decarboxylase (EC 4.1.1.20) [uncultured Gammaproteobacteria bacterium]CAC9526340.1 Diaminopimelate decarboxylase (EC 4.1.1.20) [uncultured Gammaproteobacteria bacterium]